MKISINYIIVKNGISCQLHAHVGHVMPCTVLHSNIQILTGSIFRKFNRGYFSNCGKFHAFIIKVSNSVPRTVVAILG